MDLCKDCTAALDGRVQRNPTHLVHSQKQTYGPASRPECVAKWFRAGDRIVLADKHVVGITESVLAEGC